MIKLCFGVSDIIQAKEPTQLANFGLHILFVELYQLMSFCFTMKKVHFKQKVLLWRHISFNFYKNESITWMHTEQSEQKFDFNFQVWKKLSLCEEDTK